MGVDRAVLHFLLKFRHLIRGRTLQLGRQGLHVKPGVANAVLLEAGAGIGFNDICQPDGYTEKLFRQLGANEVECMDNSGYEGAGTIHDLNQPIPVGMEGQFDVVFDGGTIEHVFDFPQAMSNVSRLLAPSGLFITVNAANNQLGHGFYQFSPELFWRIFSKGAGWQVHKMQIVAVHQTFTSYDALDPAEVGRRLEVGTTNGAAYIMMAS